jgi:hypothetical protein
MNFFITLLLITGLSLSVSVVWLKSIRGIIYGKMEKNGQRSITLSGGRKMVEVHALAKQLV